MKIFSEAFHQYNLLEHPFYRAWNEGKLTRERLGLYAKQYGSFINLISNGWENVNEDAIAVEEQEHFELWKEFGKSLNDEPGNVYLPAVDQLLKTTKEHYESYPGALGALYAFEAQQPGTAASKLQGLRDHYSTWQIDETYFEIHADDIEEPALLEEKINALTPSEKLVAELACTAVCRALYNALTDIYNYNISAN